MRVLLIHADHFEYETKEKAIKNPEDVSIDKRKGSMDEVLVAFCTVEKVDEKNPEDISQKASDSIDEVAKQVKAKNIMIYPYAHLSSELGSRDKAIPLLKGIETNLRSRGYNVARSPFGWYKSFEIKCKGHPLSELSRSLVPTEVSGKVVEERVKEQPSEFIVLEPDGKSHPLDIENIGSCKVLDGYPLLKQFVVSETVGEASREPPPHIKLMQRLELVGYEPASDIGHFRFYPKGALMKRLLEDFGKDIAVKRLRAMMIDTPLIYRLDQPDIAGQASSFRERDYRFEVEGKGLLLRFAGDFGLFRMMKDVTMSYKQLPVRIYELSPSFRLEQSGECVGLKRLRAFTMPDIHCFCRDLEQGMNEYKELLKNYTELISSMKIDFVLAFRVVKEFYLENKEWFVELLNIVNKPALIELLPEMKHYWIVKHEFQFIDSVGGSAQLSTIQLDVEDSKRYGIFYADADGEKKGCIILHSSIGSIERWIYALLEQAEKMKRREEPPMFPVWLSPTQVRIIPVSKDYLDFAKKTAEEIEIRGIRVDVDDREQTVSSRIREAEVEWVPYVVVVGEKEQKKGEVSVRIREKREGMTMTVEDLIGVVEEKIGDRPRLPLNFPRLLSMRPKFV